MAAASVGAKSSRALELHRDPSPEFSSEGSSSSSSSSRAAEAEAVARPVPCDGGGDEDQDVLDLNSPWVAAVEAESRLEEAAIAAAAAGLHLLAENDADAGEIRDNLQRQEDEAPSARYHAQPNTDLLI